MCIASVFRVKVYALQANMLLDYSLTKMVINFYHIMQCYIQKIMISVISTMRTSDLTSMNVYVD